MKSVMDELHNKELHQKAKDFISKHPGLNKKIPTNDVKKLIEDLQIYQVELELQNEELRKAQLELETERDNFSDLYDFAPIGYITISDKGLITRVNLTAATLLEAERGLLIGKRFSKYIHKSDEDIFYFHRQQLIETKKKQTTELRLVKSDDSQFYAQLVCIPLFDEKGNFEKINASISDISKLKTVEETLKRSRDEWQNTFDSMSDWICLVDLETKILRSNKIVEEYFGKSVQKVIGQSCSKVVHGTEKPIPNCPLLKMVKTKKRETTEIKEANGDRWFQITVDPLTNDIGELIGAVHILRNITVQKTLELEMLIKNRALDSITNGVLITDPIQKDNPVIYTNQAFETLTGYTHEEVVGKNCRFLQGEEQDQKDLPKVRKAIKAGISCKAVVKNYKKDGTPFWNKLMISPVHLKDGKLINFVGIQEDITDQKKAEEALRESEKFNRTVLETIPNLIYIYDYKLQKNSWMNANYTNYLKKYFDISGKEVTIAEINSLVHPDDLHLVFEASKELKNSKDGHVISFEFRMKSHSGWRWLLHQSSVLTREENGEILQTIGSMIDITERKRMEQKLRYSEERYRRVVEDQTEFLVRWLPGGIRTFVNDSYCRYFGISREEAIGTNFFELISEGDKKQVKERLDALTVANPVSTDEHQILRKDGTIGWNKWTDRALFNVEGELIEYQSVGRDITEQKLAEEELQKSQEQMRDLALHLQAVREDERTLIAREIHDELGQSLTAIKMDLAWLAKSIPEDYQHLKEKANMTTKITNQTIQRVKRITSDLRPGLLDDLGLIAAIEWQTSEFEGRTGIQSELNLGMDDIQLEPSISTAVFRTFQETLTNIARHSKATKVKIYFFDENGNLVLEVSDNGIGITQEQISSSKSYGLIGIKERIQSLGGVVDISNDEGTKVKIRIPVNLME